MGTQGPCLVLMQLSAHACNIELCYSALHSSVFLRFCPMSGLKLSYCDNILQTSIVAVYNRRVLAIICSQIMQQITSYCYKNISSVQEHVAHNQTETTRFGIKFRELLNVSVQIVMYRSRSWEEKVICCSGWKTYSWQCGETCQWMCEKELKLSTEVSLSRDMGTMVNGK